MVLNHVKFTDHMLMLKTFHKCSRQAEARITLIWSSLGVVSEVTVFPQWSDIWMESVFKAVNYSSGSVVTPPVSLPVMCRGTAGTSAERFCAEHVDLQCKPTEGEWSSQFFSVVTQLDSRNICCQQLVYRLLNNDMSS